MPECTLLLQLCRKMQDQVVVTSQRWFAYFDVLVTISGTTTGTVDGILTQCPLHGELVRNNRNIAPEQRSRQATSV